MSELGASAVSFVAEGTNFPYEEKKKSPNFSPKKHFPRKLSLTPINFMYSDRGPAIVSDEIIETARCGWRENIDVSGSDCK